MLRAPRGARSCVLKAEVPVRDAAKSGQCDAKKLSNVQVLVWSCMVRVCVLPISRKSSNERPLGSGEVECRVAAAIGYGLGALAKSIPQWKTSLANPCNSLHSLHVSHCHSRPLDDVQKNWHTSLQFGNMCANLTGD